MLKCRFCGKRIKKGSVICTKCGKEMTDNIATDELIDALPELHDEFDNISRMQEKDKLKKEKREAKKEKREKNKTKRIILSIVIVLAILGGVFAGILYVKHREEEAKKLQEAQIVESSAIDSAVVRVFLTDGISEVVIDDEATAKMVIAEQKEIFSFVDAESEFELERKLSAGNSTIYRFRQKYKGVPVVGGQMILMADGNGKAVALNGSYIPTDGLTTSPLVGEGEASTVITEYVNSLKDFAVVQGTNVTEVKRAVCNVDNKAHLTYTANVSGYNEGSKYVAYDVFVDAVNGEGVCVSVTSSFENEAEVLESEIEESYIYKMASASDRFNWNDESNKIARDRILINDIVQGNAAAYVTGVKNAVDSAYNYFNNAFSYKGLNGTGESFLVYINANEYVEEDLPRERALYTNNQLMFFREDMNDGDVDYNTVVHEYAHGVIYNVAGFRGTMDFSENSAIAEGLADVFAELAEGSVKGTAPDWVHGERNLTTPDEGYFIDTANGVYMTDMQDSYNYSTIVSYLASRICGVIPDIALQNELWFKSMCLMTRNTDFHEFNSILNTVIKNIYGEKRITEDAFNSVKDLIKSSETGIFPIIEE